MAVADAIAAAEWFGDQCRPALYDMAVNLPLVRPKSDGAVLMVRGAMTATATNEDLLISTPAPERDASS